MEHPRSFLTVINIHLFCIKYNTLFLFQDMFLNFLFLLSFFQQFCQIQSVQNLSLANRTE